MKKYEKLSFGKIQNVLSKNEMKMIMAGSGGGGCGRDECKSDADCSGTAGFPHCLTSHCAPGDPNTVRICGL